MTERQYWINMCYQKQAVEQVDIGICEKIRPLVYTDTNRVSKDICKLEVIIADPNSGIGDCRAISEAEARGKCRAHFSVTMADITICEGIQDERQKVQQIAENNGAEAVCAKINDRLARQDCFRNIALAKGKPEICAMVSEDPSIIKAHCYEALAEKLKEPALCNHVSPVLTMEAKVECVDRASSF